MIGNPAAVTYSVSSVASGYTAACRCPRDIVIFTSTLSTSIAATKTIMLKQRFSLYRPLCPYLARANH